MRGARVQLLGHLLSDPELSFTPTGEGVARFELATSLYGPMAAADPVTRHRCLAWNQGGRKLADLVVDHLQAGAVVYLEGRRQARPRGAAGDPDTLNILVRDLQLLETSQTAVAGQRRRRRAGS